MAQTDWKRLLFPVFGGSLIPGIAETTLVLVVTAKDILFLWMFEQQRKAKLTHPGFQAFGHPKDFLNAIESPWGGCQ